MIKKNEILTQFLLLLSAVVILISVGVTGSKQPAEKTVPHKGKWGIYALNLATNDVSLIYSTNNGLFESALMLNNQGDKLVFAEYFGGAGLNHSEICTIGIDGKNYQRLTGNQFMDLYAVWSPAGDEIVFLSQRTGDDTLDIYRMDSSGANQTKLFDSGDHDGDIHWVGNKIVFTAFHQIWGMNYDGSRVTNVTRITNPPKAGYKGIANLPNGDYDPRLSSDGAKIVFERLEDADGSPHGYYNIYVINYDRTGETNLTNNTGYSQGMANWSHSGDKIVYIVAAINNQGKYDVYMMNADGTNARNITPDYFPANFLVRQTAVFSKDDSQIYFIGMWWQ